MVCNLRKVRPCVSFVVCSSLFAFLASAENVKLYLKDGSYQLVREYKVENDRVTFYSLDRDDWEEVPASLVDLDKTKAEIKARADAVRADAVRPKTPRTRPSAPPAGKSPAFPPTRAST